MNHNKEWFEMADKRKPRLAAASWVPLFARQVWSEVKYPEPGYWEEFFGAVAIAFPATCRNTVNTVEWTHTQIDRNRPTVEGDEYSPASRFVDWHSDEEGYYLVLRSSFDTGDLDEIIIDPDLLLGLRLLREGDCWLCPHEDYAPVIRLQKDPTGRTVLVEIRGEHIKDFLCAIGCGLLVSTFRSRREISAEEPDFDLPEGWNADAANWEGWIREIDSSGSPYGSDVDVITMGRTDVDPEDDVPVMGFPSDGNTWSSNRKFRRLGPKRFHVIGQMWRNEWIAPGQCSPRIRGDRVISTVEFLVDNDGSRLKAPELIDLPSRWLWFSPAVINELLLHRGTELIWYTEDTGGLSLHGEGVVHFGVNSQSLVNVYAKDVAQLKVLWQRLWAAWNVAPDGKVSRELLAAQMESRPADTTAPEKSLAFGVQNLDARFSERFGGPLFRSHSAQEAIWRTVHRFVAVDENGFYRLMKELTRLCVERLDMERLKALTPDADKSLRSLKRLERVLTNCGANGRELTRELAGIYELRHSDSHLPASDNEEALALVGLRLDSTPIQKGKLAIRRVAECLLRIAEAIG